MAVNNSAKNPDENNKPEVGETGFRMNQVGRQESAREVLKQQVDPAVRRRNLAIIAVVVVAFLVIIFLSFQRSHLSLFDAGKNDDKTFGPTGGDKVD